MYILQTLKRMSATTQNNTTELIETVTIEPVKRVQGPAKNRTSYLTEAFEALPMVEGFPLTTAQLWEYFNKACKSKDIKIRKLSEKREQKLAEEGPKRLSGYNIFTREFTGEVPEGTGMMTHKAAVWKALSKEEKAKFNERATQENKSNGIEPKAKKLTHNQLCEQWYAKMEIWVQEDPDTRGPKPERPEKKKPGPKPDSSSDTSDVSD